MLKTLRTLMKRDKEKYKIPRSVQQTIPIQGIWKDGVFQAGKGQFSKTYKFSDINYAVASYGDKETIFFGYGGLINSFEVGATSKITVVTQKINKVGFEADILLPFREDGLDIYRRELNTMLMEKATGSSGMIQERYLTVTAPKNSMEEARTFFSRVGANHVAQLGRIGSKCSEVEAGEKLRILHDFYRNGQEPEFPFDLDAWMQRGHSFKDTICPDGLEVKPDHFRMGGRYGRALFLKEYGSFIEDDTITALTDSQCNMILSIDVIPIPTDEALREAETRVLGIETNITNWQRRQNQNNNFSAVVPLGMEQQRQDSKEFLSDLTTRDQRMTVATVTLVHTADTLEQLNTDTEALQAIARSKRCQLGILRYQQLEGLNTALPIGVRKVDTLRTLTTESLAVMMPFRVQEIMDKGGIYYGENTISKNLIFCNKENLLNPNAFLFGVPGSGKSFAVKEQIAFLALTTDDDILICDVESEYVALVEALGGVSIRVAPGSGDHINALDMVEGYGDNSDPVINKSGFMLSVFELIERTRKISAKENSIIDRCLSLVYKERVDGMPTLFHLHDMLMRQPEPEARELALSLELFTSGTLDIFAHPTNVDTKARIINYNIRDLGEQMKPMGALVITDAMLNRVARNWEEGRRTHVILDEFHVLFSNEHSANFFNNAWRRFRKRNAFPTAITQNVEYLLESVLARTMLSNSEFLVMLNQAESDRQELAKLLNISETQMNYISGVEAGTGLIRYGSTIVPFTNRFPRDTNLYKLMTTKANEKF